MRYLRLVYSIPNAIHSLILFVPMAQRIYSVDAVRALALLMILVVHVVDAFGAPFSLPSTGGADEICVSIATFCRGRGMLIFSFLFGLSFFLQLDHARDKGIDFRARFCLRLFFLLCFGLLHSLFYRGDILIIFAVIGYILVGLDRLKTWILLVSAAVLFFDPIYVAEHICGTLVPVNYPIYDGTVSLLDHMHYNIMEDLPAKFADQFSALGRGYQTLIMFIMGAVAGRVRFFEKFNAGMAWRCGLILGFLLLVLRVVGSIMENAPLYCRLEIAKMELYCTVFLLIVVFNFLCSKPWTFRYLHPLFSVGRTTLTAYIAQGVLLTLLFYDIGMGWAKFMTPADRFLIAVVVYILQALLAEWWLQFHKFGPLEGVWRWLTRIGMKG